MVFQSGSTVLHPHQQFMRVPTYPYFGQHLLLSFFKIITHLVGIKKYLTMVLIYVSLMANDIE